MPVYCDESGGIGKGVMTLATVYLDESATDAIVTEFRALTGHRGELKGSRIDLDERAVLLRLLAESDFVANVSIAISVTKAEPGEDRGDHDIAVYTSLLRQAIGGILPRAKGCAQVIMDDGRYGPKILSAIRSEIGKVTGPFGLAQLELSHISAGLQIADVIANSFFNRARVTERQGQFAALLQPMLDSGQIIMELLSQNTKSEDQHSEER